MRALQAWRKIARQIANWQAQALLTVFYATVMLPFGVFVRSRSDFLRVKQPPTQWLPHDDEAHDLSWAKRQ